MSLQVWEADCDGCLLMKKILSWVAAVLIVGFCSLAWFKAPDNETVWLLVPAMGLFRIIAGTWNKPAARFLSPLLLALAVYFLSGWSWWILAVIAGSLAVGSLPVTLIGNSIPGNWVNWVWVWVYGGIKGLPSVAVALAVGQQITLALLLCLVPMLVHGLVITLSNLKATKRFFPWKFCEFCMGSSVGYPPALLIDLI